MEQTRKNESGATSKRVLPSFEALPKEEGDSRTATSMEMKILMPSCDAPSDAAGGTRTGTSREVEGAGNSGISSSDGSQLIPTCCKGCCEGSEGCCEGCKGCCKGIKRRCTVIMAYLIIPKYSIQNCCLLQKDNSQHILESLQRYGPVVLAFISIIIMALDLGTDVRSTHKICTVPCKCVWNRQDESCEAPGTSYDETTKKNISAIPECLKYFGSDKLVTAYCDYVKGPEKCKNDTEWLPWDPAWVRHPYFCGASGASIAFPSVVTSGYLFYSLKSIDIYPELLIYLGFSKKRNFVQESSYIICLVLLVLCVLQLLPYVWLMVLFIISIKEVNRTSAPKQKETSDLVEGKETVNVMKKTDKLIIDCYKIKNISKIMFTILEDVPQIILHSIFIINSAITEERFLVHAGIDMLDPFSYFGAFTSAFSIALTVRQFMPEGNALMQIFTTFVSVGIRAMVCACYASSVTEGFKLQTWTLIVPPSFTMILFMMEYFLFKLYERYERKTVIVECNVECNVECTKTKSKGIGKLIKKLVSINFESNTVECLITSYTYLAAIISLSAVWIADKDTPDTDYTFNVIYWLAFTSLLLNSVVIIMDGKHNVTCLTYSLIFLVYVCGIYFWIRDDFLSFKRLFFPDAEVKEKVEDDTEVTLSLGYLTSKVHYMAGANVLFNLLILIISFIKDVLHKFFFGMCSIINIENPCRK